MVCELPRSILVTRSSCPIDFGRQGPDYLQLVQCPYLLAATTRVRRTDALARRDRCLVAFTAPRQSEAKPGKR